MKVNLYFTKFHRRENFVDGCTSYVIHRGSPSNHRSNPEVGWVELDEETGKWHGEIQDNNIVVRVTNWSTFMDAFKALDYRYQFAAIPHLKDPTIEDGSKFRSFPASWELDYLEQSGHRRQTSSFSHQRYRGHSKGNHAMYLKFA